MRDYLNTQAPTRFLFPIDGDHLNEQYFYEDYKKHRPDFEARVLEPAKYLFEKGYQGTFLSEIL